jgi:hypothetical protein
MIMIKQLLLTTFVALTPLAAFAEDTPGEHFMLNWDLNEDGAVTVAEITERREMVFAMFDDDENNALDAEEYVFFDETRAADMENNAGGGHGQGGGRMQKGLTLAFNDTDSDGSVSLDEFLDNSAAWIELVDRDGDGAITSADFGPKND